MVLNRAIIKWVVGIWQKFEQRFRWLAPHGKLTVVVAVVSLIEILYTLIYLIYTSLQLLLKTFFSEADTLCNSPSRDV
jgi:hypothetical protein